MPSLLPYLLLLPATAFLAVFFLYPFALVAIDSVTVGGEWGLGNFAKMTAHWKFGTAFWNTMLLAALVVPSQLAMALTMASIVTRLQKGRSAILCIFAIPLGISDLAAGLVWLVILEQTGFLNSVLHGLGVIDAPILFLSYQNAWVILLGIILAEVWRATAIMMVILAAGMGLTDLAGENRHFAERGVAAMEGLWSEAHGQYLCRDRVTGALIDSPPSGGCRPPSAPSRPPVRPGSPPRSRATASGSGSPAIRLRTRALTARDTGAGRSGWW